MAFQTHSDSEHSLLKNLLSNKEFPPKHCMFRRVEIVTETHIFCVKYVYGCKLFIQLNRVLCAKQGKHKINNLNLLIYQYILQILLSSFVVHYSYYRVLLVPIMTFPLENI